MFASRSLEWGTRRSISLCSTHFTDKFKKYHVQEKKKTAIGPVMTKGILGENPISVMLKNFRESSPYSRIEDSDVHFTRRLECIQRFRDRNHLGNQHLKRKFHLTSDFTPELNAKSLTKNRLRNKSQLAFKVEMNRKKSTLSGNTDIHRSQKNKAPIQNIPPPSVVDQANKPKHWDDLHISKHLKGHGKSKLSKEDIQNYMIAKKKQLEESQSYNRIVKPPPKIKVEKSEQLKPQIHCQTDLQMQKVSAPIQPCPRVQAYYSKGANFPLKQSAQSSATKLQLKEQNNKKKEDPPKKKYLVKKTGKFWKKSN